MSCFKMMMIMWNKRKAVTCSYLGGNNERSLPHWTDHQQPISVQFCWYIHQPLWQHKLRRRPWALVNKPNIISSSSSLYLRWQRPNLSAFNKLIQTHKSVVYCSRPHAWEQGWNSTHSCALCWPKFRMHLNVTLCIVPFYHCEKIVYYMHQRLTWLA